VLVYDIVSFSGADNHDPFFCSEAEIGRADHIAHILDEEDISEARDKPCYTYQIQVGI
jgi:hypothetical protein